MKKKTKLEEDLHNEQDSHQRTQKALTSEKEQISLLQFEIHDLTLTKRDHETYKREMVKLVKDYENKFEEQDKAMQEMAEKLESSITREDENRDKDTGSVKISMTSTLTRDASIKQCNQCKKELKALSRKRTCGKCNQVFCDACTKTKKKLTGSSKSTRVCDTCAQQELQQELAQCVVNNS